VIWQLHKLPRSRAPLEITSFRTARLSLLECFVSGNLQTWIAQRFQTVPICRDWRFNRDLLRSPAFEKPMYLPRSYCYVWSDPLEET
jgi:hypothetical protein